MLIHLLYGDNETLLCNTQCATVNLLNYIRRETRLDETVHIDLANETGIPWSCMQLDIVPYCNAILANCMSLSYVTVYRPKQIHEGIVKVASARSLKRDLTCYITWYRDTKGGNSSK